MVYNLHIAIQNVIFTSYPCAGMASAWRQRRQPLPTAVHVHDSNLTQETVMPNMQMHRYDAYKYAKTYICMWHMWVFLHKHICIISSMFRHWNIHTNYLYIITCNTIHYITLHLHYIFHITLQYITLYIASHYITCIHKYVNSCTVIFRTWNY